MTQVFYSKDKNINPATLQHTPNPASGFVQFYSENREEFARKYNEKNSRILLKIAGTEYRNLSESEKKKYLDKARTKYFLRRHPKIETFDSFRTRLANQSIISKTDEETKEDKENVAKKSELLDEIKKYFSDLINTEDTHLLFSIIKNCYEQRGNISLIDLQMLGIEECNYKIFMTRLIEILPKICDYLEIKNNFHYVVSGQYYNIKSY